MSVKKIISVLTITIAVLSSIAAAFGIFSEAGPGPSTITSVRGQEVKLYGEGVYHHMSQEVAPQGIAQDYVTLFIAVPILLVALYYHNRNSERGRILLTGTLAYFLMTYTFFTLMAMYNKLFLLWVVLISLCFFAFYVMFNSINQEELQKNIESRLPNKFIGGFLMFNGISISLLWLSIVLPHVIKGTIPTEVEHYTTLVVQALDLSIALPVSFIAGYLLYKGKPLGYKSGLMYIIFLTIQMTALTAKIVMMGTKGYNIIPAVFIIPVFNLVSLACSIASIKNIKGSYK